MQAGNREAPGAHTGSQTAQPTGSAATTGSGVGAAGTTAALAPGALMSGASGVPGFSLTIRKRTTSSAIRRVRSRPLSSSGDAGVELQQVVLRRRFVGDRVGQRPIPPIVVAQQLALRRDRLAGVREDLRARRLLRLGVEQQHEIVCGCGQGHANGRG